MADWEQRIYEGLRSSRVLLACLSPNYFASEWCRREWQLYLEHELDHGVTAEGIAPIYFVGSAECDEKIADWTRNISHRQYLDLRPFFSEGPNTLQREEIRFRIAALDQEIAVRIDRARRAERSPATIPPHNRDFVGRTEQLRLLRQTLFGGRVGVIASVHGVGGIGKSALAFEYAHAMASDYPGGRWLLPCESCSDLREVLYPLGCMLGFEFTAEEASDMEKCFVRVCAEILTRERMLGSVSV